MRATKAVVFALSLAAALELPAWGRSDVARWASELEGADPARQIAAARLLGRSGKDQAVEPLLRTFDVRRGSPRLTTAIVVSLGELKDPRALEPLLGAWDYLNSARLQLGQELPANLQLLRATIVEAAGAIGTERSQGLLDQAINDRDALVVQKAAWGLGAARDKRGVEALISLLNKGGPLAQTAFEALGAIGDSRGTSALQSYLKSDDAPSRIQAAYALSLSERSDHRDSLAAMQQDRKLEPGDRVLAAYYLAKLGDHRGLDYLAATLKKGSAQEKALAIQALGKCGRPKAVPPLIEAAKTADAQARMLVAGALGQLGGARAVNALRRLSGDRNLMVKTAARLALLELGKES